MEFGKLILLGTRWKLKTYWNLMYITTEKLEIQSVKENKHYNLFPCLSVPANRAHYEKNIFRATTSINDNNEENDEFCY